jgi:hypothetical protein
LPILVNLLSLVSVTALHDCNHAGSCLLNASWVELDTYPVQAMSAAYPCRFLHRHSRHHSTAIGSVALCGACTGRSLGWGPLSSSLHSLHRRRSCLLQLGSKVAQGQTGTDWDWCRDSHGGCCGNCDGCCGSMLGSHHGCNQQVCSGRIPCRCGGGRDSSSWACCGCCICLAVVTLAGQVSSCGKCSNGADADEGEAKLLGLVCDKEGGRVDGGWR